MVPMYALPPNRMMDVVVWLCGLCQVEAYRPLHRKYSPVVSTNRVMMVHDCMMSGTGRFGCLGEGCGCNEDRGRGGGADGIVTAVCVHGSCWR